MMMKPSEYLEIRLQTTFHNDAATIIDQEAKIVSFSAGHTVLWEGDTSSCLYYIIKGVVRGYYIDCKGNDITKCFCAEKDFFSTEGFRTSASATFTIECLEDCQCLQLPYESLNRIIHFDTTIRDAVSNLFQAEISKQEARSKNLMLLDAENRYVIFCREYPQLLNRIALKHIASYIGVRAASLSRIRKHKINIGE